MPFTVDDFEDLLRLLYERPEWQERLRRAILPPELFELPRIAQELADANRADRERVARLEAEQQATRQDLREGFAQTGERLDRVETDLAAFRTETNERFEQVDRRFEQVDRRFDRVEGRLQQLARISARSRASAWSGGLNERVTQSASRPAPRGADVGRGRRPDGC